MADFTGTRFPHRFDRQTMHTAIPVIEEQPPSALEHDAAVRMVLRMAASCRADVADAGLVCAMLGLSLKDALERSQSQEPT